MTTAAPLARDLRSRLEHTPQLGTFVKIAGGDVIDLIALAGFDFAVLDLEHSQLTYTEARHSLAVARANGLDMTVRIPTLDTGLANRLLEAGAAGIQMSTVRSADTARRLAQALRYGPVGSRSISLSQPAARYGATPLTEYLDSHTHRPLIVGQLETVDFDNPIEDIVRPLDVAFIGTLDLSVAAGTPGDHSSPVAAKTIDSITAAAQNTDTALGIFTSNAAEAERAIDSGFHYIVVSSDLALLRGATTQLGSHVRQVRSR